MQDALINALTAEVLKALQPVRERVSSVSERLAFIEGKTQSPDFGKPGDPGKDADVTPFIEENRKLFDLNQALREENAAIKAQVEDLTKSNQEVLSQFNGVKKHLEQFKTDAHVELQKAIPEVKDWTDEINELKGRPEISDEQILPIIKRGITDGDLLDTIRAEIDPGDVNQAVEDAVKGLDLSVPDEVQTQIVEKAVTAAIESVSAKADELKGAPGEDGKPGEKGEAGERGEAGASVDMDELIAKAVPLVTEAAESRVDQFIKALPIPDKGKDGEDGKSVDLEEVVAKVIPAAQEAAKEHAELLVKELPPAEKGDPGERGEPGKDGESVDLDEVLAKVVPVVQESAKEHAEQLVKDLPQAKNGKDGLPGEKGEQGKAGEGVHPDTVKTLVTEAVKEEIKSIEIPKPKDGENGKDALSIDVLPSIDLELSHQAKTYAAYRGGVIMSTRKTQPVADGNLEGSGWVVVQNGIDIDDMTCEKTGKREITVDIPTTAGRRKWSFDFPIVLHEGPWDREKEYDEFDQVQFGGSTWNAKQASTGQRPTTGSDYWYLANKRGSDGKDGERGAKGEKGDPGAAGKDLTQLGPDGRKW